MQRKLAAILYADVAGYSRLTGADEEGTHRRLAEYLDTATALIESHDGKVLHFAGDAVLAEFASAVVAVTCAVDLQRELATRNADLPQHRRLEFRVGINAGDVIVDRGELYGDGVNVAARLESLAEPGGICVGALVYEQVRGKLDVGFQDLGPQAMKNIAEPIRAYHVRRDADAPAVAPPLPDRPSIAVLPFTSLSPDPEQSFLADGMTEDITTALARFRWLFVIARNSSFAYKDRATDVKAIAAELGVRYVLEGSVRSAGPRVRVSGQLIDATTGNHLWAERYDRELLDVFAIQDEVTDAIVAAIAPEIDSAERSRAKRTPPEHLDAWLRFQSGLAAYFSSTEPGLVAAIEIFDEVMARDPGFAPAHALAADARTRLFLHFRADERDALLDAARALADRATEIDARESKALWASARVELLRGNETAAEAKSRHAIELNPNDPMAHFTLGFVLRRTGQSELALTHLDQAIRLSPFDPFSSGFQTIRSVALFTLARYPESVDAARRAADSSNSRFWAYALLAAGLLQIGELDAARDAVRTLLTRKPDFTLSFVTGVGFGATPGVPGSAGLIDAWRELGIPQ